MENMCTGFSSHLKKSNLKIEKKTMEKKVLALPLGVKRSIYQFEMDYALKGNCPLIWW